MRVNNFFKLVIAIGVSELAGVIGSVFMVSTSGSTIMSSPSNDSPQAISGLAWYSTLVKPALNPPAWVFGPVWTALYFLMGISLFLVWSSYAKASEDKKQHSNILKNMRMSRMWKIGIAAFFVQLSLNAVWSIIFFGLHGSTWLTINNLGWALVDIILLWLAIAWTMVVFYKISRPAAYLLVPYILWVSFAMYLNYAIWALN